MTIFMKVYLTLLVISFFVMIIGGIAFSNVDDSGVAVCMFPFLILFLGGLLYGVFYLIWGV